MMRWAAWAACAALAAALLGRLLADRRSPLLCDTTYIHEGYEEVPMPGAAPYRLVAWRDRDSSRAAGRRDVRCVDQNNRTTCEARHGRWLLPAVTAAAAAAARAGCL